MIATSRLELARDLDGVLVRRRLAGDLGRAERVDDPCEGLRHGAMPPRDQHAERGGVGSVRSYIPLSGLPPRRGSVKSNPVAAPFNRRDRGPDSRPRPAKQPPSNGGRGLVNTPSEASGNHPIGEGSAPHG